MSYKNFIAFVVTPSENYEIFCHFGSYDKGFYGNTWSVAVGINWFSMHVSGDVEVPPKQIYPLSIFQEWLHPS